MVKLKRLKIHRYRNVEPCELIFSDRRNVLLGPNGAGKTTLLSLISKILRTNLSDPGDPFSIELELTFPQGSLTGTIASREPKVDRAGFLNRPSIALTAREGAYVTGEVPDFEIVLKLAYPQETIAIRRSEDKVTVQHTDSNEEWSLDHYKETLGFFGLTLLIAKLNLGDTPINVAPDLRNACRFDESLEAFHAFTATRDDISYSKDTLRPIILVMHFSEQKTTHIVPVRGVVPNGILKELELVLSKGATDYSMTHEQLAFLSEVVRLLGLRSAIARIELIDKNVHPVPPVESLEVGNLKFWFTRRDGSIFQDQHLSYGQKRLLAFLYYLDANPSFVIADELVNGLHHAWIEECMTAIGDRQAFLTSQNPLLLDYLTFESAEQVKESFILCRNQANGDRERMIWRNMTDDEADMFYRAYQVGIEHVGEILRTRGLW
ncbi:AAA family ATPase [Sorangium sp. So ce1078]|uniref:AAA family ATPase n=1 Tax=Sorangium sp. So ce1078 TaxID=3133329 RepID=UPI003F5FADA6